jgi:hypothetical protein
MNDGAIIPLVSAILDARDGKVRVTGRILGKPSRCEGKSVAVELQVLAERAGGGYAPTTRFTLVPLKDVEPLNEAAGELLKRWASSAPGGGHGPV